METSLDYYGASPDLPIGRSGGNITMVGASQDIAIPGYLLSYEEKDCKFSSPALCKINLEYLEKILNGMDQPLSILRDETDFIVESSCLPMLIVAGLHL